MDLLRAEWLAASAGRQDYGRVFFWCGLLIALILAAWAIGAWLLRRMRGGNDKPAEPWTLHDLRRLLADGQLTQDEFDRLRQGVLARMGLGQGSPPSPEGGGDKAEPQDPPQSPGPSRQP